MHFKKTQVRIRNISVQTKAEVRKFRLWFVCPRKKEELQKTLNELKETQLQLINSEKMASLGQLIASVAHVINTPIASISANNEILKKLFKNLDIDKETLEMFQDINGIDFEAIKRITIIAC